MTTSAKAIEMPEKTDPTGSGDDSSSGHKWVFWGGIIVALIGLVGTITVALINNGKASGSNAGPGPSASSSMVTTTETTPPHPSPLPPGTHEEIADRRGGVQVFSDTNGGALLAAGVPRLIEFERKVQVTCKMRNTSAVTSVPYWYRIASDPWRGLWAPSDLFANGDPVGVPGPTTVDTNVPNC